jgi:hypothetical protein
MLKGATGVVVGVLGDLALIFLKLILMILVLLDREAEAEGAPSIENRTKARRLSEGPIR